ncbi:MAG: DnaJ domain-containing protein [Acidobacteriota bacterium]
MSTATHYDVLGVSRDASLADIRRAYRRLAHRCHPDIAPRADPARFRSIREAYEVLSDDTRRRAYDRHLAAPAVPVRVETASFGDEIAIDFPSVSSLVCRIWSAFAGQVEQPVPLSAEIELTREEASRGARVPLAVPLRTVCAACAGRGEIWLEVCRRCAGRGERTVRHRVTVVLPPGMTGGERFAFTLASASMSATPVELRIAVRPAVA